MPCEACVEILTFCSPSGKTVATTVPWCPFAVYLTSKKVHFEMVSELVELKCILILCIKFYFLSIIYLLSIRLSI